MTVKVIGAGSSPCGPALDASGRAIRLKAEFAVRAGVATIAKISGSARVARKRRP